MKTAILGVLAIGTLAVVPPLAFHWVVLGCAVVAFFCGSAGSWWRNRVWDSGIALRDGYVCLWLGLLIGLGASHWMHSAPDDPRIGYLAMVAAGLLGMGGPKAAEELVRWWISKRMRQDNDDRKP